MKSKLNYIVVLPYACVVTLGLGAVSPASAFVATTTEQNASASEANAALIKQAQFWHDRKREDLAQDALDRILTVSPNDPDALLLAGQFAAEGGNIVQAQNWLAKLRASVPGDARLADLESAIRLGSNGTAYVNDARRLASQGRFDEAVARYDAAFGKRPPSQYAVEYYETMAGTSEGWDAAHLALQSLSQSNPSNSAVQRSLGEVLTYREETRRDGIALLAKLSATDPKARASWRRALLWLNATRDDEGAYLAFLKVAPDDPSITEKLNALSHPQPVDQAAVARADGFKALESGNLAVAGKSFTQTLADNPQDPDALGGLGLVDLKTGNFIGAEDKLSKAVAAPDGEKKWGQALVAARFFGGLARANAARDAGRLDDAQKIADRLTGQTADQKRQVTLLRADLLSRRGQDAKAEDIYKSLIAKNEKDTDAVAGLSQSLLRQNKVFEAEVVSGGFSPAALAANPALRNANGNVQKARAAALVAKGDIIGATHAYEDAIALSPNDPWLRLDAARLARQRGNPLEGRALVEAPMNSGAPKPEAFYAAALYAKEDGRAGDGFALMTRIPEPRRTNEMRQFMNGLDLDRKIANARLAAQTGSRGEAVATLMQLSRRSDAQAQTEIASALMDMGESDRAVAVAQMASTRIADGSPVAYAGLVDILARAGRETDASLLVSRLAQNARTQEDRSAVAGMKSSLAAAKADRLRLAKRYADAFDILSYAMASDPGNVELQKSLGRLYQSGGLKQQALDTYRQLLEKRPNDPDVLSAAAEAALAYGDQDAAKTLLVRALQKSPSDPQLYLLQGRIAEAEGNRQEAIQALTTARDLRSRQINVQTLTQDGMDPDTGSPSNGLTPNPFRQSQASGRSSGRQATVYLPMAYAAVSAPEPDVLTLQNAEVADASAPIRSAGQATTSDMPALFLPAGETIVAGDRMTGEIDQRLASLQEEVAPQALGNASVSLTSGESGLSNLTAITAEAAWSVVPFDTGRLTFSAQPVVLDAGAPAGTGVERFGTNALTATPAIPDSQNAAGLALAAAYTTGDSFSVDVGVTPIGFEVNNVVGGVKWSPEVGDNTRLHATIDRRAVTDSVLSYAGTIDDLSGNAWGGVVKTGGEVGVSFDNGPTGLYASAGYHDFTGQSVADNSAVEANAGAYIRPYQKDDASLQVGANINYQAYDKNLRYFTFGQGGYFSPQQFLSLSFPFSYQNKEGRWSYKVGAAPGIQTYNEDRSALFPNDPAMQQAMESIAALNATKTAYFASDSKSGMGIEANGAVDYEFAPDTHIGGKLGFNNFGSYSETTGSVYLKLLLGQ